MRFITLYMLEDLLVFVRENIYENSIGNNSRKIR